MPATILSTTAPATYRVLRAALLSRDPFHQIDLVKQTGSSPSQVSRVLRWLMERGHAERMPDGRYRIRGAAGVVTSAIPYQRAIANARVAELRLRGTKESVKKAVVRAGGILCIESALEEYSEFFRADRVCAYHGDPEKLIEQLAPHEGGILPLEIYVPDLSLKGDVDRKRRTTKFRTVLDLACSGKVYAAKELLEELWGVVIE